LLDDLKAATVKAVQILQSRPWRRRSTSSINP
jgi:hypothetical protein